MLTRQDWQTIDTVLLDMDGTLLDLHFDNYFWLHYLPSCYAKANNISQQQAMAFLQPLFISERGTLQWYCLDFWQEKTGLEIAKLKHDVAEKIQLRPHALEFLQRVRAAGKTLMLVTNAHRDSVAIKMANTNLEPALDAIHSSHDFGAPKEQADFWPRFQQATDIDPGRSLFIDDTESVLNAARDFGIGYTLTIHQPDSQQQRELVSTHPGIDHFDEIMPT